MDKNIGKNISKSLNSKYSQKRLDDAKNPQQRRLKLLQKESFKKQWKQLVKNVHSFILYLFYQSHC